MDSGNEMHPWRIAHHGTMVRHITGNDSLISPRIGHAVARFFEQGGAITDRIINSNYRGPLSPKNNIETFLGEGRAREKVLDELYNFNAGVVPNREWEPLLRNCHELLKYAGSSETGSTQVATFKFILSLTTRYPGIRKLFNLPQDYQPSTSGLGSYFSPGISSLFNRSQTSQAKAPPNFGELWSHPDEEFRDCWIFHRDLAIYCLSDTPLTKLVESVCPSEFTQLHPRHLLSSWNNEKAERLLLSFCAYPSPGGAYDYDKICAIRYLSGFLELPTFWSTRNRQGDEVTERLFGFLSELCKTLLQLIADTEPNHNEDVTITWLSVAREAVDKLTSVMFNGFLCLLGAGTSLPPCPHFLWECINMAVRPYMEKYYPRAFACALQLNNHIYLVHSSTTNIVDDAGSNNATVQPTVVELDDSDALNNLGDTYINGQENMPTSRTDNQPPGEQYSLDRNDKKMRQLQKQEAKRIALEAEKERRKRMGRSQREQARAVLEKRRRLERGEVTPPIDIWRPIRSKIVGL